MSGIFAKWQSAYAEHGIATFPVKIFRSDDGKAIKKPIVRNWQKFGAPASRDVAKRHGEALRYWQ